MEPGLEALYYHAQDTMTYGHGLHLAVVDVDADTGVVRILRYAVVYDVGRAIKSVVNTRRPPPSLPRCVAPVPRPAAPSPARCSPAGAAGAAPSP